MPSDLALLSTLTGSNYPCLGTNFHGPKGVRAIEVLLYIFIFFGEGGGGGGGWIELANFFSKNLNLKKETIFFCLWGWGVGG